MLIVHICGVGLWLFQGHSIFTPLLLVFACACVKAFLLPALPSLGVGLGLSIIMAATCSKTSSDSKRGNFEEDDVQMPLKLVKELLKQQESTLKVFLSAFMSDRMQPKYLNTSYLYFPLNTLIYLNKRLFSLFLKMPPSI